jgi:hypothetical protein
MFSETGAAVLSLTPAASALCRKFEVVATGECRRKVCSTRQRKGIRRSSLRSKTLLAGEQANLIKRRLAKFVKANWPRKRRNFQEKVAGKSAMRKVV